MSAQTLGKTPLLGDSQKLFKPRARMNIRKNVFSHGVEDNWNSLPTNVTETDTLHSFKVRLNKHWVGDIKFKAKSYSTY